MDLPMMVGIGIGALLFVVVGIIAVAIALKRIFGGNKMKTKQKVEETEETEEIVEPDENDIETADEEETEEQRPKQQLKPEPTMVTVVLTNGAKHTGEFLGDDPQYTMLALGEDKKLVKMDSYWVNLKTETMVIKINRRFVLSITQLLQKQPKSQAAKSKEVMDIEAEMDKIMDV